MTPVHDALLADIVIAVFLVAVVALHRHAVIDQADQVAELVHPHRGLGEWAEQFAGRGVVDSR